MKESFETATRGLATMTVGWLDRISIPNPKKFLRTILIAAIAVLLQELIDSAKR